MDDEHTEYQGAATGTYGWGIYVYAGLALSTIAFLAFAFWHFDPLNDAMRAVGQQFATYAAANGHLALVVFWGVAIASSLFSLFTTLPLVPIAVFLWGPVPAIGVLMAGWLIGDALSYSIGRYLGYPALVRGFSQKRVDRWLRTVHLYTNFKLMLVARFALPSELGYAFGMVRYTFWKYMVMAIPAHLPFAIVMTYASDALIGGRELEFFAIVLVTGVLIFAAVHYLQRYQYRDI